MQFLHGFLRPHRFFCGKIHFFRIFSVISHAKLYQAFQFNRYFMIFSFLSLQRERSLSAVIKIIVCVAERYSALSVTDNGISAVFMVVAVSGLLENSHVHA